MPKYVRKDIIKAMSEKGLVKGVYQRKEESPDSVDLSGIEEEKRIHIAIQQKKETVSFMEDYEYEKSYKHAALFEYQAFSQEKFDELHKKGLIFKYQENTECNNCTNFDISYPIVKINDDQIFIKFNLIYNGYNPDKSGMDTVKYPILAVVFLDLNILEVRFDRLSPIFRGTRNPYSNNIKLVLQWMEDNLGLEIAAVDLFNAIKSLPDDDEAKEVVTGGVQYSLKSGSKATLDVGSNENYVLPILGELEQLINEYEEEFNDAPKVKQIIEAFIDDIKTTSDRPWMSLCWPKTTKKDTINVKFTFFYEGEEYCLLQYKDKQQSAGRMDYVTRYLIDYQRKGNN